MEEVIKYASNQYVLIERERLERLEHVAECARDIAYSMPEFFDPRYYEYRVSGEDMEDLIAAVCELDQKDWAFTIRNAAPVMLGGFVTTRSQYEASFVLGHKSREAVGSLRGGTDSPIATAGSKKRRRTRAAVGYAIAPRAMIGCSARNTNAACTSRVLSVQSLMRKWRLYARSSESSH